MSSTSPNRCTTRRLHRAGIQSRDARINKPPIGLTDQEILCVIAYLQSLGGTPTVTLQTSTTTPAARRRRGAQPAPAAPPARREPVRLRPARRSAGPAGEAHDEDPVVLAVAAAFGLLRFRRPIC
jgi:hypothetical protein